MYADREEKFCPISDIFWELCRKLYCMVFLFVVIFCYTVVFLKNVIIKTGNTLKYYIRIGTGTS